MCCGTGSWLPRQNECHSGMHPVLLLVVLGATTGAQTKYLQKTFVAFWRSTYCAGQSPAEYMCLEFCTGGEWYLNEYFT